MDTQRITSLDDPRAAPYRNLPDRTLRGQAMFVAEGLALVRRLLASRFEVESLLVADEYVEEFSAKAPPDVPVYVAAESLLPAIVGFPFHRGALAVGKRPAAQSLDDVLAPQATRSRLRWVVCPEITKPENMGLVLRSAAALGADGVLLGQRSCDPFSRRCLRVSMGAVFQTLWVKSGDVAADLRRMRDAFGFRLTAAVLDGDAEDIDRVAWGPRAAVLIGNEWEGLAAECLALCHSRATIAMQSGVDSLNLGVAAGIFLYAAMRSREGLVRGQFAVIPRPRCASCLRPRTVSEYPPATSVQPRCASGIRVV